MVDITRHPREVVTPDIDFRWDSGNSIVWKCFRAYEYLFGRRSGIRFECSSWYQDGISYRTFGTWENVFVFAETTLRDFFKDLIPRFKIIRIPILVTHSGLQFNQSPFRFAIGFDVAENTTSTTTLSHTVTGSNVYLFASTAFGTPPGTQTTATYNSVSMTSSATVVWIGTDVTNGLFLAGPSTGTHNISLTSSGGGIVANSYSGVSQSAPDTYGTNTSTSSASIPLTLNTATANCWMVMLVTGDNGTGSASTNATVRANANGYGASTPASFDSNSNISTGSFTMTTTSSTGTKFGQVGYKFAQVAGAAVNSGFFFAAAQ